jgi:hypothetical protein
MALGRKWWWFAIALSRISLSANFALSHRAEGVKGRCENRRQRSLGTAPERGGVGRGQWAGGASTGHSENTLSVRTLHCLCGGRAAGSVSERTSTPTDCGAKAVTTTPPHE